MANFTQGKREGMFHPTTLDKKRQVYDRLRKRSYRRRKAYQTVWGSTPLARAQHKWYVAGVRDALNELNKGA